MICLFVLLHWNQTKSIRYPAVLNEATLNGLGPKTSSKLYLAGGFTEFDSSLGSGWKSHNGSPR